MDIKRDLLMFLYDNRQSLKQVRIDSVFKDTGLAQLDIRVFLRDLEADGIIQVSPNYRQLANITAGREATLDNTHVIARLTPIVGEQYVRDNFLPKPDPIPTIQAHQVVYNTGQINAPISQTDNHSSLSFEERPITTPTKADNTQPTANTTKSWGTVIWQTISHNPLVSAVISGLILTFILWLIGLMT